MEAVSKELQARGISFFRDKEVLVPGMSWPKILEDGLRSCGAVAVFLGPAGIGAWQQREIDLALDFQSAADAQGRALPVIPILLPNTKKPDKGFLYLNTWIELKEDWAGPMDQLERAIRHATQGSGEENAPAAECPYRALQAFTEEYAPVFHGRELLTAELLAMVLKQPRVTIVGASGSGKSSVVMAGLIPQLRRQRPPQPAWASVVFRPGHEPWSALAMALTRLKPDLADAFTQAGQWAGVLRRGDLDMGTVIQHLLNEQPGVERLLLVVDQFEELLVAGEEGQKFLAALMRLPDQAPVTTLLTLRADYYGHALKASRELADALVKGQVNVGPMTRTELGNAIVKPAQRARLKFEHGLDSRILDEIEQQPGSLPLLEYALTELWAGREGPLLTHAAYERSGGLRKAIATKADAAYAKFDGGQQEATRRLMTRLVRVAQPGEDGGDTRRRVRRDELDGDAWKVGEKFAGESRLLVIDAAQAGTETVEIAHEALIQHWDRLKEWVGANREFLLWRQRLRVYLGEWKKSGPVLQGKVLNDASDRLKERCDELSDEERQFIELSQETEAEAERARRQLIREKEETEAALKRQQAESAEKQRRAKSMMQRAAALVAALVLVAGFAAYRAREGTRAAQAGQLALAARNYLQIDRKDLALGKALEAYDRMASRDTEETLHRAYQAFVKMNGHEGTATAVAYSGDGSQVATGGEDGRVIRWTPAGSKTGETKIDGAVLDVEFDGAGRVIVAGVGGVRVVEGERVGEPLPECAKALRIAVQQSTIAAACDSGPVVVYNAGTVRCKLSKAARAVALSRDGKWLATAGMEDNRVRLWEAGNCQEKQLPAMSHGDVVNDVAFNATASLLASGALDGKAILWEVASGKALRTIEAQVAGVSSVAFSEDGERLATGGRGLDTTVNIWESQSGAPWLTLTGHESHATGLAFAPKGPARLMSTGGEFLRLFYLDAAELRGKVEELVKSGAK